jgi:hypothetical protein
MLEFRNEYRPDRYIWTVRQTSGFQSKGLHVTR